MNVSNEKIEKAAEELSSKMYKGIIDQLYDQIYNKINSCLIEKCDPKILEAYKKDNFYFSQLDPISVRMSTNSLHFHFDLPMIKDFDSSDFGRNEGLKLIKDDFSKYTGARIAKRAMKHKIICALNTLKTLAKIKANFPEAYEIITGLNAKDSCTDIEALRAELNTKNEY